MIARIPYPDTAVAEAIIDLLDSLDDDPVAMLAQAHTWLMPIAEPDEEEDNIYDESEEPTERAYVIFREQFPDLYMDVLDAFHAGGFKAADLVLYRHFVEETLVDNTWNFFAYINAGYIPYEAYGVDLEDDSSIGRFDFVADLIGRDINSETQAIALVLARSLNAINHPIYDNLTLILRWLYLTTGNTLMDETAENIMEGYEWSAFDYAFECQQEALDFFRMALKGVQALEDDALLFHSMECNVRFVRDLLAHDFIKLNSKGKIEDDTSTIELEWYFSALERDAYSSDAQLNDQLLRPWRVHPDEQYRIRCASS